MNLDDILGCYALVYNKDGSFVYCSNTIKLISGYRYDSPRTIMYKLHDISEPIDYTEFFWISEKFVKILGNPDKDKLIRILYSQK